MRTPQDLALIAAIADDLPAGVWVATVPEGRFVYSNRAFADIMGMGPVTDVGVGEYAEPYGIFGRDGQLYPEERMPFVRAMQERVTVIVDDIVIHRRDKSRVYLRAFAKPMFDGEAMTHIAVAFFDITREVEAQLEREKALAKLAQAERLASIGMLAAGVAHEINNPLSYVIGSLELVARTIDAARAQRDETLRAIDEKVADARHGAERVQAIVRDLKMFSRARDQQPTAVDVRSTIESSLHIANNEIRHRARVERDLRAAPLVWAEEGRLAQLFLNLLVNAAQAIDEGDAEKHRIRVATCTGEDGWAAIEVSDTGAGIPSELLPRIFDPFFTTKPGVGTGLGLSICHSIVTGLGGRIEVESRAGGTTFRVALPPAGRAAETMPPADEATPGRRRGRVLVIDDEPLLLKVIGSVLAEEHDVVCETSAGPALERIRRGERYDAIVCDLMMPQLTGMDLYDALVEIAPKQAQAMLFLSGGAFTARAQAFLNRVPNARIDKPFASATLVTRVRQVIG